ncbi:MAG TPA: hypothetical protein VM328_08240 [Fimbriimonadaceae bacterium]|nr:hypothetical protein [Fimbriimonadaceae bacterium]
MQWLQDVFRMSGDRTVDQSVKPGDEIRVRVLFQGPKGSTAAKLVIVDDQDSNRRLIIRPE